MGLHFRRSIRIAPGVKLNFGKKSMSISFGGRGARITYGTKGTTVSSGIPGTGIYYRKKLRSSKPHQNNFSSQSAPLRTKAANKAWGWVFIIMGLFCLYFPFFTDMEMMGKIIVGAIGVFSIIGSVAYFTAESTDDIRTYEEAHPDALIKNPFSFIVGLFLLVLFTYLLIKSFSWNDMSIGGWFFYPFVIFFLIFGVFAFYIGIRGEDAGDFKKDAESRRGALIKVPFVFFMGLIFFIVSGYLLYASFNWKYMSFWGYLFYPIDILFLLLGAASIFAGAFGEDIEKKSHDEPLYSSSKSDQTKQADSFSKTEHAVRTEKHKNDNAYNSSFFTQDDNLDLIEINIYDSLPVALRYIAEKKGLDYFQKQAFFISINKNKEIQKNPTTGYILRQFFTSGSYKRLVNTSTWENDSQSICDQFVRTYGVKEDAILYIIKSFGYAIGVIKDVPQNGENITVSQPINAQTNSRTNNSHTSTIQQTPKSQTMQTPIDYREPYTSYQFPTISLLDKQSEPTILVDLEANQALMKRVENLLNHEYDIAVTDINITNSNIVDYIECSTQPETHFSSLNNNVDSFSLALSPKSIRLFAPIPGTDKIGIEMPAAVPQDLNLITIFESGPFKAPQFELPCFIGRTPSNEIFGFDLTELPHLLVSGASGQGKSSCIHNIIMSLLFKKHPNELKFILVDFKKIEFATYEGIGDHFLAAPEKDKFNPIVSDSDKANRMFNNLKAEFDARFNLFALAGVRNIKNYNTKYCNRQLDSKDNHKYLPYIVVVIDEYTELISSNKRTIESIILDLVKKGRIVGIHFIIGINRPTADIIDSNIKNEITGRIAFKVNTSTDSRLILDANGAEKLYSAGDALYMDKNRILQRVQCPKVKYEEIDRVCNHIKCQIGPTWPYIIENFTITMSTLVDEGKIDPLFEEIARCIILTQNASASMIQRRFSIGYNRVNHILDQLERLGVIGKALGINKREVLIADEKTLQVLLYKRFV